MVQSANPFDVKDQHRSFTTRFALLPFHDSPLNFEVTSKFTILTVRIFSARSHGSTRAASYAPARYERRFQPLVESYDERQTANGEHLIESNVWVRTTLSLCCPSRVLLPGNNQALATTPENMRRIVKKFVRRESPLHFSEWADPAGSIQTR